MVKIRKYETVTDINVYEVELTEEQLKIYQEDIDLFVDEIANELDWDFVYDKVGDLDLEYELRE